MDAAGLRQHPLEVDVGGRLRRENGDAQTEETFASGAVVLDKKKAKGVLKPQKKEVNINVWK